MTLPVIFSPRAENDLAEIEEYLERRFSPRNATRYVQRIIAACNAIALAPYRGTKHDEIRPGVRSTGFEGRVTIIFEVRQNAIAILFIDYGGRVQH